MMGVRNTWPRRVVPIVGLLAVVLIGAVESAHAVAIVLQDRRVVLTDVEACSVAGCVRAQEAASPSAPFDPFLDAAHGFVSNEHAAGIATATQAGSVTPSLFTGEGTATASAAVSPASIHPDNLVRIAEGASAFFVLFELLTPHRYVFEGSLARSGPAFPRATLAVSIPWAGFSIFEFADPDVLILDSGVLVPDVYILEVVAVAITSALEARENFQESAGFDFRFALTELAPAAVPEPASIVWLSVGAGLFGFRCLRKSRNRDAI